MRDSRNIMRKYMPIRPNKCFFCEYDVNYMGVINPECQSCIGFSHFEVKNRMHPRQAYEWYRFQEHERKLRTEVAIDLRGKIVMAFTDPVDEDPPETRYRYFTEKFTGEGVHMYCIFNNPEDFINKWLEIYDKPNGMWYWVLDDGVCICSGAVDPSDIDGFREHWNLKGD